MLFQETYDLDRLVAHSTQVFGLQGDPGNLDTNNHEKTLVWDAELWQVNSRFPAIMWL